MIFFLFKFNKSFFLSQSVCVCVCVEQGERISLNLNSGLCDENQKPMEKRTFPIVLLFMA